MLTTIDDFTFSDTCLDVFLSNYICPTCHAQPPMCPGRCIEITLGCVAPLSQSISQLQTSIRLMICKIIR